MSKVPAQAFGAAVRKYLQAKVIPLFPSSLDQFFYSAGLLKFDALFADKGLPLLERLGFLVDGQIDMDALDAHVRAGFGGVKEGKLPLMLPTSRSLFGRLTTGAANGNDWLADLLLSVAGLGKQDLEGVPTIFRAADWEEFKALI